MLGSAPRRDVTSHAAGSPWPEMPEPTLMDQLAAMFPCLPLPEGEPPAAPAAAPPPSAEPPLASPAGGASAMPAVAAPPAVDTGAAPLPTGAAGPESPGGPTPNWSHMPPAMPLMPPLLAKSSSHELAGCANYMGWRDEMVGLVKDGKKPPAALLTLLEASLYKLSDDDLKDEYRWYAEQYMSDNTSAAMQQACEMIVIRIGEIVNMPQGARIDKRKHNKRLQLAQVTPRASEVTEVPASVADAEASFVEYVTMRDEMMETRRRGWKPPSAMYAELDMRMFLLSASDQIREYKHLATVYLDESEAVAVRGLVELRLTKLGEILYTRLETRLAMVRSHYAMAQVDQSKPNIAARAEGVSTGEPSPMKLPGAEEALAAAAIAAAATGAPPAMGADGKPLLDAEGRPMLAGPDGKPLVGADGKPLPASAPALLGEDGKPIVAADGTVAAAGPDGKALVGADGEVMAAGVPLGPDGQPLLGEDGKPLTGKPLDADGQAMQGSEIAAAAQQAEAMQMMAAAAGMQTPGGAPGAAGEGAGPSTFTPGKLPSWVVDDEAWGKTPYTGGGSDDVSKMGVPKGKKAVADGSLSVGEMSKLNWFQRMRQREHLGGRRRDEAQLGIMSLQDALAKEVATFGKGLQNKAPSTEIETEGTDSRPVPTYAKPAEYMAMQEMMISELSSVLTKAGGEGGARSSLKKVDVKRPVPWQQAIQSNPQSALNRTGRLPNAPQRSLTGIGDVTA